MHAQQKGPKPTNWHCDCGTVDIRCELFFVLVSIQLHTRFDRYDQRLVGAIFCNIEYDNFFGSCAYHNMSDTIDQPLVHWAAVHTFSVPKEAGSLFRYLKVCNGLVLVVEKNYKKRVRTKESGKVS